MWFNNIYFIPPAAFYLSGEKIETRAESFTFSCEQEQTRTFSFTFSGIKL